MLLTKLPGNTELQNIKSSYFIRAQQSPHFGSQDPLQIFVIVVSLSPASYEFCCCAG